MEKEKNNRPLDTLMNGIDVFTAGVISTAETVAVAGAKAVTTVAGKTAEYTTDIVKGATAITKGACEIVGDICS